MASVKPTKRVLSPTAIGIDVAKATLSVCFRLPGGEENALTFRNTETDIRKQLLSRLSGFTGRIVLESTNHYHWQVALLLTEAGYDVRVVNPLLAKQYTSANIRKVKTDPMDARGLARMAEVADNLPPRFCLSRETLYLRKKLSSIATLSTQLQALRANVTQLTEANDVLGTGNVSCAETALHETILHLKNTIDLMEEEFVTLSKKALKDDTGQFSRLDAIPGVTPFVALLVLHWFSRLPGGDAKSWIAYAGLDISSRESGTWQGKCHLTKRGNSFLRKRLYSAAWGSTMTEGPFKVYYNQLREQGRPHVESLLMIARKIVRIMFKLIETGQVYDPTKLGFAIPS